MESTKKNIFGMIGLGTMGRNVLLNMADHNFAVAGYDKDPNQVTTLDKEDKTGNIKTFHVLKEFVDSLQQPRAIMMLVPAGKIVDDVINDLLPLLDKEDIIIDGGNSYYHDTERRDIALLEKGLHFFGMGISGGEEGARKGPSMMPGGDKKAYEHVRSLFETIAAQAGGEPCVTYIGPGASGHFVKMVHNGIEYALMQLIAETYDLLKTGLQLDNKAIHELFKSWNNGRLRSFLLEITADIFLFMDAGSDDLLVDKIRDEAKAKGTGKWTSQAAMDIQLPVPCIDTAVSMRDLSKYKGLRTQLSAQFNKEQAAPIPGDPDKFLSHLEEAFYFSMVITYSQGMHLLYKASQEFKYDLQPGSIAKIWRGGCIIRSAFLEDIAGAYANNPALEHLLADDKIAQNIRVSIPSTRYIAETGIKNGIALPLYSSSLNYFDYIKRRDMPANLIQAQRDFFGAHTYERIDRKGIFHTDWLQIS